MILITLCQQKFNILLTGIFGNLGTKRGDFFNYLPMALFDVASVSTIHMLGTLHLVEGCLCFERLFKALLV